MSIEVLRIATKDYDVSVNTNEIRSAWNRFKKRTYAEALTYCDYCCSSEAHLSVMNADTGRLESLIIGRSSGLWFSKLVYISSQ